MREQLLVARAAWLATSGHGCGARDAQRTQERAASLAEQGTPRSPRQDGRASDSTSDSRDHGPAQAGRQPVPIAPRAPRGVGGPSRGLLAKVARVGDGGFLVGRGRGRRGRDLRRSRWRSRWPECRAVQRGVAPADALPHPWLWYPLWPGRGDADDAVGLVTRAAPAHPAQDRHAPRPRGLS